MKVYSASPGFRLRDAQPQTDRNGIANISSLKTSWQVTFVLYFFNYWSPGNVWHFKALCADVVFLVAFFQPVFRLGFACYHSSLRVMLVRKIWLNAALCVFIFTSSGDQEKKKIVNKRTLKVRKGKQITGIQWFHSWFRLIRWLGPGIWQYPLMGHSVFRNMNHSKKKKWTLPCFLSQWPFSMILFLTIFSLPLQAGWLLKSASPPTNWA